MRLTYEVDHPIVPQELLDRATAIIKNHICELLTLDIEESDGWVSISARYSTEEEPKKYPGEGSNTPE